MASLRKQPKKTAEPHVEGPEADGRIHLPPNVTTTMAEDLRAGLVLAADHDEAILIDASETQSIGQAAVQLLVAAKLEAERLNLPFAIEHARPELVDRITALGLADMLELAASSTASAQEGQA